MPGPSWWRHYGLGLPDTVLEALYRGNAKRIMNWVASLRLTAPPRGGRRSLALQKLTLIMWSAPAGTRAWTCKFFFSAS